MANVKIFQFFDKLSEDEIKKAKKFLNSGFFPSNKHYEDIINFYFKKKVDFRNKTNTESIDFISTKLKISKNSLHNRLSELTKIFESFLTFTHLNGKNIEKNLILLDRYDRDRSYKLFDNLYPSVESFIKNNLYDFQSLRSLFQLYERISTRYFYENNYGKYLQYFKLRNDYDVSSFIFDSLINFIEINQQKEFNVYEENLLGDIYNQIDYKVIIDKFAGTDKKGFSLLKIFFLLYKSFDEFPSEKYFPECLELHRKNLKSFSRLVNEFVFLVCTTYCIKQTNKGNDGFYKILFDLINQKIKAGYVDEFKVENIPVNNFRDYVIIALKLGETEWVKKFVAEFSKMLPDRYRDDETNIALGLLKIEEKKYEEAIKLFNNVKKTNYLHYIDSGMNKTRAFYLLELYDEAIEEIKKVKNYFSYRQDIPPLYVDNAKTVLKDIEQLLRFGINKIDTSELSVYFRKRNPGNIKKWIKEELGKLKINLKQK